MTPVISSHNITHLYIRLEILNDACTLLAQYNPPLFQVGDLELNDACTLLAQSLKLREKYMEMSQQRFFVTTKRHLQGSYGPIRAQSGAKAASRGLLNIYRIIGLRYRLTWAFS